MIYNSFTLSDKAFKHHVMTRASPSLNGESFEMTLSVPLISYEKVLTSW